MKKFTVILLTLMIVFGTTMAIYFASLHNFPEGRIFNYFENNQSGNLIQNLDDYIAAQTTESIIIYDKKNQHSYTLADSVFDAKKQMVFLMKSSGDTLYYFCLDPQTKCTTYYSFNLDTYDKNKISADSTVTNTAGFLGMESVFGIRLRVSKLFSIMQNLGKYWLNDSGIHNTRERGKFLSAYDKTGEYGTYDSMDKIAETDKLIFFVNYFGELICFNKESESFSTVTERLISDFFITENKLYYITKEETPALYEADYNGKNASRLGETIPTCVRFSNDKIFIADEYNSIYDITTGAFIKVGDALGTTWTADADGVYMFDAGAKKIISNR